MLTPEQLDTVYTKACQAMNERDPEQGSLFLARLCLLLMQQVGDEAGILKAISSAGQGIPITTPIL